ncbi:MULTISPECIES: DDE-type integrase/transposase/recombinase [Paraburkholderia]|uniref:Mu transposase C-terminal domain-containing protein n=1 Tax=Paraburkholderia TaxID=1822464 RepID=UPI0022506B95|nr:MULTISPECIES: DDE-type integrase/transposase/recombinase [Paraburkholderia]MCX4164586.1 DDE-type integrase/transposase/recombinase [Paraburkholderia megapolitana]MDN7160079.1 DDE-type integrase/transposase/recombinase [Paraburkholderia sp. CHISQ3]MDQ6497126.1 DDE-type integrase/transposase/recombinase [Paraburkholderia megapolitana]
MANFIKDQIIFRGEGKFRLARVQGGIAQLENITTGEFSSHNEADLLNEYVRGYLRTATRGQYQRPPKRNAAKEALEAAYPPSASGDSETRRRMNYLTALDRICAFDGRRSALRKAIHKIAVDLDDAKPPHETTVYRWRRRYLIAQRDIRAIFDQTGHRGGAGQSRLDPVVEGVVHDKIETAFLNSKSGTAEDVHNAVFLEIQRLNTTRIESEWLKVPGLRTIQRRIEGLSAFERAIARYGECEAQRRFADQSCARKVSRILEIVEIDHTPMDIMYTDASGRVIDRPVFTVVLDRFSRCVLGFCISSAGHGVHAVFEALRHALMPKGYLRDQFPELLSEWPCHGWFERLLMDNGREFHAHAVVDALTNLGVICEYAGSRDPNDKPFVERFLKTFNYSFIHKLPGTTLAKIHQRVGFKSEDEACITFEQLNEMVHVWITSVYHLRPHRGLSGRAPIDVWKESAVAFPPELKCNAEDLSIEFGEFAESALQHYGIDFNTFRYVSTELLALRRMLPARQKVQIKAPYENAGLIWVWDPIESRYIRADNIDEQYNNLTVEQAKAVDREYANSDPHRRTRANAQETIREKANEAMQSKKSRVRKQGARLAHTTSKSANRPQPVPSEPRTAASSATFTSNPEELSEFEVESTSDGVRDEK